MKTLAKLTKTEALLLALTILFLLLTGAVFFLRERAGGTDYIVRNETRVSQELSAAEEETSAAEPETPVPTAENPLNINTASAEELEALPGIGPALSERIVAFREEHGPFETKEDLMQVEGIGEKSFAELQDVITVEDSAAEGSESDSAAQSAQNTETTDSPEEDAQ